MAIDFTVETGNADPDANSYVDVGYFDDYAATNPFRSSMQAALPTESREILLVRASKYIDVTVKWNGTRVDQDSGLRWPRAGVYDADGFEISDDTIPPALKDATCELALYLMDEDWTSPQGQRGFQQIQVDVIDIKMTDNYVRPSLPDLVIDMLNALGSVNRGTRPAFRKIIRS